MAGSGDYVNECIHQNHDWATTTAKNNPDFFPTLAAGQHPQILWLGCSDSRVPETTILGLKPGDVFVHRNIANILPPNDLNSQSVILYAVEHLKVQHVVVCGHTSCGGAAAALGNEKLGLLDTWLVPLKKIRAANAKAWSGLSDQDRAVKLVEANVRAGVQTLRENSEVIHAEKERGLVVHGLVYDVACGELKELDIPEEKDEVQHRQDIFVTEISKLLGGRH